MGFGWVGPEGAPMSTPVMVSVSHGCVQVEVETMLWMKKRKIYLLILMLAM